MILRGELGDDAEIPQSAALVPYPKIMTQSPPLVEQLQSLVDDGSRRAALALWLLAIFAPRIAWQHTHLQEGDSDWMRAVRGQIAEQSADDKSESASRMTPPAPISAAIVLSRCRLFAELPLCTLRKVPRPVDQEPRAGKIAPSVQRLTGDAQLAHFR
jgi:hypothetical protein